MTVQSLCRIAVLLAMSAALCGPAVSAQTAPNAGRSAAAAWHKEFDDVCSRTSQAMSFSVEQLARLVARCDALQSHIERLDETQRKVFTSRLHQCRGLYAYVLESKQNETRQSGAPPEGKK